jgi:2-polyprenyl-6-methoxyphenol hydroxylase-like FAD-dependent oxidoreductase
VAPHSNSLLLEFANFPIFSLKGYAIKREELVHELHKMVKERKIEMCFNLRLQRIEETANNKVVAHFKDGETIEADLLVGCDGIHSVVRQYVTGDASDPNFSGTSIVLGLATFTPEEEKEHLEGITMWIGNGSFFGCVRLDNNGGWGL